MRWFGRRKSARGEETGVGAAGPGGVFLLVLAVGDEQSERTVSAEVVARLVGATKGPALAALDRYFGGDAWCPQIKTHTSRQGPCAYFAVTVAVPRGETQASMSQRIRAEFTSRWDQEAGRLL
ncbi:hypothetical protein ABZ929_10085 [Streptomyces physcomitrii]|uniref:hypothetical protein n=1 Tax=Streptomyces physcomitrii TaxID=2724184 RepID=UPI0033FA9EB8